MLKHAFHYPADTIYMCGHSLGPSPKIAITQTQQALQDWSNEGVTAWNSKAWMDLPYSIAQKIAILIGALACEVVVSDSTSVNLYKVLRSALFLQKNRKIILTTHDNFPADHYIAQGITAFDQTISLQSVEPCRLIEALNENIAVLMLTHVNFRSADVYDMQEITKAAHQFGILVIWDLSHSVGIMPIALQACNVDFAIGCTYKYLNGGPGSPSFIYVNQSLHDKVASPIYGWMGHQRPFAFESQFQSHGAANYIGGTPTVLSLKALEGALSLFEKIDLKALYDLTLIHSNLLINALKKLNLQVITPQTKARAGHIAIIHDAAYALSRALIEKGVICDFREPNVIRLCINPLYLEKKDIKRCLKIFDEIIVNKIFQNPKYQQRARVT